MAALAVGRPAPVGAQTAETAAVESAFKQAFAAQDVEAVMALYAEDAVEVTSFGTFRGRAEIRTFIEAFFAQNPGFSVSYSESAIVLNTAVRRSFFTSDTIKAAGVSRIVAFSTTVVAQGTIASDTGLLDLSDPETARFAALMAR